MEQFVQYFWTVHFPKIQYPFLGRTSECCMLISHSFKVKLAFKESYRTQSVISISEYVSSQTPLSHAFTRLKAGMRCAVYFYRFQKRNLEYFEIKSRVVQRRNTWNASVD